jgi:hypothetical protein
MIATCTLRMLYLVLTAFTDVVKISSVQVTKSSRGANYCEISSSLSEAS